MTNTELIMSRLSMGAFKVRPSYNEENGIELSILLEGSHPAGGKLHVNAKMKPTFFVLPEEPSAPTAEMPCPEIMFHIMTVDQFNQLPQEEVIEKYVLA